MFSGNNLVEIYDFDNKNVFNFMLTDGKYMLGLTKDLILVLVVHIDIDRVTPYKS